MSTRRGADPQNDSHEDGGGSVHLSVVVPAFNEEARLGASLERITNHLEATGRPYEVLVVDDGSTDGTVAVGRSFAQRGVEVLEQGTNRGKGAALRAGVLASRGEQVLLCDADLSTPIEEVDRLQAELADCDLVLGSRAVAGSRITQRQPIYRELMGKTFNRIIQLLAVRGFKDTQCGFKLLDGAVARRLFQRLTVERFAYDVELVWLAQREGLHIREVGVTWADSPASKVHPVVDSARMLWDVLLFRFRHRRAQHRR